MRLLIGDDLLGDRIVLGRQTERDREIEKETKRERKR
jgi:zinc finger CCCH domain-containing protein 13